MKNSIPKDLIEKIEKELLLSSLPKNNNYTQSECESFELGYLSVVEVLKKSNHITQDLISHNIGVNYCVNLLKEMELI